MENKNVFQKDIEPEYRHEEKSLGWLAMKGGIWVFALKILHRGFGLVRIIILARILSPNDFGLFGIAFLVINWLEECSNPGINAALVQKKDHIKDYLDVAWTAQLLRSVVLSLLLFFGGPLIAHFFSTPQVLGIIRVLALSVLLTGAGNIGLVYFQKELRFDKLFVFYFAGLIVNISISITMAFILRNVWALVYGALGGAFAKCVVSYALHSYRPRLRLEAEKLKELFQFGKWVFGSSLLVLLITQGDDAFVGKILGLGALGLYQMAYRFSNAPATEIGNLISRITFPLYSKMQDNIPRLREAFLKVLQLSAFLSAPISGLIFVLAPDFTKFFLGEKWMPMVPAMQVLTLWGFIRSIEATTSPVFYAAGKPKITTKLRVLQLMLIIAGIYPLTLYKGILGTSLTIVIGSIIPILIACYMAIKITQSRTSDFAKMLLLPLVNTAIMFTLVSILRVWLKPTIIMFFANVLVGILAYICVAYLFSCFLDYDVWFVLRRLREGIRK